MNNTVYEAFQLAKKQKDLSKMKRLCNNNPNEPIIKFEYAKLLVLNGDFKRARKTFRELLNTSNRNYALFELGKMEKKLGNLEKSRVYFTNLLGTYNEEYALLELGNFDYEAGNLEKSRETFEKLLGSRVENYALFELALLEMKEVNDAQMFKYLNKLWQDKSIDVNYDLLLYLSKKLNIFFDFDYSEIKYTYTLEQFLDYDEYCAIEHILERHSEEFSADVDIYKLFIDVSEDLVEENKVKKLSFNDIYLIKKDNIGADGENNLFVVTLPNTKDIITMYPLYNERCIESDMDKHFVKKINRSF